MKRPGDGPTPWHSDLNMCPLDTNDFVTAWIPLAPVPPKSRGGSALVFAGRSHRDFALNHWRDPGAQGDLTGRYRVSDHGAMALGDVTWHHGWVLHSAPPNALGETRIALAVSFVADGARLLSSGAGR
ncbi:unnamed protein product [Discosporangium mesarthrocarpum]